MRENLQIAFDDAKKKGRLNPLIGKGLYEYIDKQLSSSEQVIFLTYATVGILTKSEALKVEPFNIKNKTLGVLVITDRRILHCWKILFDTKVEQIALENINNIESKGSIFSSVLRVQSITNVMEFDIYPKYGKAEEITKIILELIQFSKNKSNVPNNNINDPFKRIEKLKELLDKGVLTEEEFQNKKSELLKNI
jgi:hypothetical protein